MAALSAEIRPAAASRQCLIRDDAPRFEPFFCEYLSRFQHIPIYCPGTKSMLLVLNDGRSVASRPKVTRLAGSALCPSDCKPLVRCSMRNIRTLHMSRTRRTFTHWEELARITIVIVCLPAGRYGTIAASACASQMMEKFQ
ncbi:hypothetical protein BJY01DRAFT_216970 [Aspergillus pseudoustus]|uniref:Uncharacterized protein n=1 Tax=Aspergillus pseudoustus TaxID=1810923 RepID=A0ABR4JPT3_9EURO